MHNVYEFVSGPLLWIAMLIFLLGSVFKIFHLFFWIYKKERFIFSFLSFRYGLRSILHWILPFASVNMRKHPVMTIFAFSFHICAIMTPLFLSAHIILLDESWNLSWPSIPDTAADIMTMVVLAACLFFFLRRILLPEVRFVTGISDYVLLCIVAAPFVTGFYAYHQWPGYGTAMILHMVFGEILLVAIPFTRLNHMLFALFSRAYTGSEFGGVRNARDW